MYIKINTLLKASFLKKGDTISKFPTRGNPVQAFDPFNKCLIETFDVQFVNEKSKIISLILTKSARILFALPVEISKLFISEKDLVEQDVWWLLSRPKNIISQETYQIKGF